MILADRGYTRALHRDAPYDHGCICKEEFEHGGPCQNARSTKDASLCKPCSQKWHWPDPCPAYVPKGYATLTTQCARCGWDSAEHLTS